MSELACNRTNLVKFYFYRDIAIVLTSFYLEYLMASLDCLFNWTKQILTEKSGMARNDIDKSKRIQYYHFCDVSFIRCFFFAQYSLYIFVLLYFQWAFKP